MDGVPTVRTENGGRGEITKIHVVPRDRRRNEDSKHGAVLLVKVEKGQIKRGDEIRIFNTSGRVHRDRACRIEENCMEIPIAASGTHVGILLEKSDRATMRELIK